MPNIEHSHWDRYHTRIIPEQLVNMVKGGNLIIPEKLQLICIPDGKIFHEVEVTREQYLK